MSPWQRWQWHRCLKARLSSGLPGTNAELPEPGRNIQAAPLLAVDLETSGLCPQRDAILSVGWVAIDNARIQLSTAREYLVDGPAEVGQSAVIHGIRDCDRGRAEALETVLTELLEAASGRVFLAHHAGLDLGFLAAAMDQVFARSMPMPAVDTLAWAQRRAERHGEVLPAGAFKLAALRQRLALPPRQAHAALADALSCAEVALVMMAQSSARLGEVVRWWR